MLPLVVDILPSSFSSSFERYLPSNLGLAMVLVTSRKTDFAGVLLTPWAAAGLFALYTVVVIAVATWLLVRRDAWTGPAVGRVADLALVLGGGGIAGIAWHAGVLAGLVEGGVDVTGADLLVGTSAGATVAALLGAGRSPAALFDRQVDPSTLVTELRSGVSVDDLIARLAPIYGAHSTPPSGDDGLGAMALATVTVDEATRRRVIAARLDDAGGRSAGSRWWWSTRVTGDRRSSTPPRGSTWWTPWPPAVRCPACGRR